VEDLAASVDDLVMQLGQHASLEGCHRPRVTGLIPSHDLHDCLPRLLTAVVGLDIEEDPHALFPIYSPGIAR
jgi:hypothetical protein